MSGTIVANPAAGSSQRQRPAEMLKSLGTHGMNIYEQAYKQGLTLSAFLEREDPSDEWKDGLDAFSRLMKEARIISKSNFEAGIYASKMEAFDENDATRALFPEWACRQYRRAAFADRAAQKAFYQSGDDATGSWLQPYMDAAMARAPQIAPAVPISEVVAFTTPISGDAYRAFYLTDVAAQERFVRVSQGAELPRAKLTGADQTVRLYKYGRALEISYELLRRARIDLVGFHIGRIAVQAQVDKLATILDIAINGDGNNNAATSYNLTSLDAAAVAGTMTLKGWLTFKSKFRNPYAITAVLSNDVGVIQLQSLNAGSANIPLVVIQSASNMGSLIPINPELADNVRLGLTDDAPSLKLVGMDTRFAIERVVEVGADITEVQRWITRQVQVLAMSEVEGYDVFDKLATRVLNFNA